MTPKNTICLWFDKNAHQAAKTMKKIDVAAIERAWRG
jgi:hypothetical protein